jgi:hypothetical protein
VSIFPWKKRAPGAPASSSDQPASSAPRKRIAVLGLADMTASSAAWSVHSFPWSYKGETTVIADYDVAIVNLLETGPQETFIPRGLPTEIDGDVVLGLLRAAGQILLAGGEIVVLGHPEVSVKPQSRGPFAGHWSSLPEWTGMLLQWEERAGDQVELLVREGDKNSGARFLPYLRLLERYEYSLIDARPSEHFLRTAGLTPTIENIGEVERTLRLGTRQLARTRRGLAVASEHDLRVLYRPIRRPGEGWTAREGGTVVLLPGCGMPAREAVAFLLREVYGVNVAVPAPPWLASLPAPGEAWLVPQLAAAQAELDAAAAKLATLEAQRAEVRDVLGTLAIGDDELEDRVRELLARLGADVEPPIEPNKEDGWIHVKVGGKALDGVLEIKSTRKDTFDETGPRQLREWVPRTQRARGGTYKGIFIGNSAYARAPSERSDPFSSSFRKSCEDEGFVAVTVATLLRELGRVVDDGADPAEFWEKFFQARGVLP